MRYTSVGGVVVGCRRFRGGLRVDVCDTGAGIAEEQQRNIFGEFYRIQPEGQEAGEGLGLGLAIVERLCTLLDHPLALTSIQGRGSRFSISLSIAPTGTTAPWRELPTLVADTLRDKLVVVIDDDPLVRDATMGLLKGWGCHVVVAASSAEASARLGGAAPDLIVSDLHLPGEGTGVDAIDALRREFGSAVPAFLISGDISVGQTGKVGPHGHPLLHKPVSPMALRAMMTAMLKRSAAT